MTSMKDVFRESDQSRTLSVDDIAQELNDRYGVDLDPNDERMLELAIQTDGSITEREFDDLLDGDDELEVMFPRLLEFLSGLELQD